MRHLGRAFALTLALFTTACGSDLPTAAEETLQAAPLAGVHALFELPAQNPTVVELVLSSPIRGEALRQQLQAHELELHGFHHFAGPPGRRQYSVFMLHSARPAAELYGEFLRSEGEFLSESIRLTRAAMRMESDPAKVRSYERMLRNFVQRERRLEHRGPDISRVRFRGAADNAQRFVRGVMAQVSDAKVVAPEDPTISLIGDRFVCPYSYEFGSECDYYDPALDNNYPDADARDSDHDQWVPSEGKSYLGEDQYSKYAYQHMLWGIQRANMFRVYWDLVYEQEVIQMEGVTPGFWWAEGRYQGAGWDWIFDTDLPSPYYDTRASDDPHETGEYNTAVGSLRPEDITESEFHYFWTRFSQSEFIASQSPVQIKLSAQWGPSAYANCTSPGPWCLLQPVETYKMAPFSCGHEAPNSMMHDNNWFRWYDRNYKASADENDNCPNG